MMQIGRNDAMVPNPEGATAPAVLLHGFGDSPECWAPFLTEVDAALVRSGHRPADVVAPPAPGHARRRMPPGQPLDLAFLTDVASRQVAVAVERAGRPVVLGGHSMGAATAVAVAAARPELVAGVFLEDPPWNWPAEAGSGAGPDAPPDPAQGSAAGHAPGIRPDPAAAALTTELSDWISGLQASSDKEREQWCRNQNPDWPEDEYPPWARSKGEVDPAVFNHPIDLAESGWREHTDLITCPVRLIVGEPALGSLCDPEVTDYLAGAGWLVTRISGACHDVRRHARSVVAELLAELLSDLAHVGPGYRK